MEQLKHMKEMLMGCVQGQMTHLDTVDTKELGEAIDMIKDLSEAIYYCTITKSMEEKHPAQETMYYPRNYGMMYYDGNGNGSGRNGSSPNGSRTYDYREYDIVRDQREGKSPMSRKMYMESKEMHKDKAHQLQELEKYAQELTADLVEMVEGASPEEKQFLSNKIAALATKIK